MFAVCKDKQRLHCADNTEVLLSSSCNVGLLITIILSAVWSTL